MNRPTVFDFLSCFFFIIALVIKATIISVILDKVNHCRVFHIKLSI